jgi:hypothetical protein
MKSIKLFTVLACTVAWFGASANLQAGCCDDAKKAGKACSHKCCVEAVAAKKTCEKCNPKKDDKAKTPEKK